MSISESIYTINRWLDAIARCRLWFRSNICHIAAFIAYLIIAIALSGCTSTNFFYEHDAVGLDLTVPICGQRVGVTVGSVKSSTANVRGGTSFNTQSATGTSLTGASTATRVTTFRANSQLNEGNIVKIMESPAMSEKAKVVLAKQIGDGVVAPDFEPTAMRTRDGVIYSNGYKGSAIPNDFTTAGVEKIVEDATGIVNNITDSVVDTADVIIGGTTNSFKTITQSLFLSKIWMTLSSILVFLLSYFVLKKRKRNKEESAPEPPSHPSVPDLPVQEADPGSDAEDAETGVIDLPVDPPKIDHPVHMKKKSFWKRFFGAIFAMLSFWRSIDDEDKEAIAKKISGKKK